MVAAGVAGAAVGAVAANALADDKSTSAEHQVTQPVMNKLFKPKKRKRWYSGWLWVLLAAAVAFFVFRKLGSKKLAANNPYAQIMAVKTHLAARQLQPIQVTIPISLVNL